MAGTGQHLPGVFIVQYLMNLSKWLPTLIGHACNTHSKHPSLESPSESKYPSHCHSFEISNTSPISLSFSQVLQKFTKVPSIDDFLASAIYFQVHTSPWPSRCRGTSPSDRTTKEIARGNSWCWGFCFTRSTVQVGQDRQRVLKMKVVELSTCIPLGRGTRGALYSTMSVGDTSRFPPV